jgi:hypothetical protein
MSPKRKEARRRRNTNAIAGAMKSLAPSTGQTGRLRCHPVDDSPGRQAVAWDRRRAPPDYAYSGHAVRVAALLGDQ